MPYKFTSTRSITIKKCTTLLTGVTLFFSCNFNQVSKSKQSNEQMVWIEGGTFTMGTNSEDSYEHERPTHQVKLNGFWMDKYEVTNQQFAEFVEETNYQTLAERKVSWEQLKKELPEGTPKPPDADLEPGSLVFTAPKSFTPTTSLSLWWRWVKGANWKHPEGPGSDIKNKMNYPVVHVAVEDINAYCKWAGKRLPTEAEWEYACRGKNNQGIYPWGNELTPNGVYMANTFQGTFPHQNLATDKFPQAAPIGSFAPNHYGLYDMIGNVWEWTSDLFDANYYQQTAGKLLTNPKGSNKSFDPVEPMATKYVTKGGSYLCADNFCINYRITARQGTSYDSGMSHLGFRCVKDKE